MTTPPRGTYPPEKHFLRDLRTITERHGRDRVTVIAPVVPELCIEGRTPRVGVMAALVDLAGAAVALSSALPDWIATADLSYTAVAPVTEGPLVLSAHLVRAGSKILVVGVDVADGQGSEVPGPLVGRGRMSFARIPGSATVVDPARIAERPGRFANALPTSGFTAPVLEQTGVRVVDAAAGVLEIDRTDYTRNSFGSLNGGTIALVAEAAATEAVHAAGHHLVATDVQVHYLAQTEVGPGRTAATILRGDHRSARVDVAVVDAGNRDRLLALVGVGLEA
jgi:acyl-coenzyme A thioesterase PaaI-like protein